MSWFFLLTLFKHSLCLMDSILIYICHEIVEIDSTHTRKIFRTTPMLYKKEKG